VAAGLVLAVAAPAAAHNWVVSTTPADGQVLTELPDAWEVVTNENLLDVGDTEVFGLWARDADGLFYGDGCVEVSGARMSAVPAIGAAGAYTLVYSFVSADGHPLTGEVPFEWAPAAGFEAASGSVSAAACGEQSAEEPGDGRPAEAAGIPGDVWWILAAVLAVAVAIALTVVLARRRPRAAD